MDVDLKTLDITRGFKISGAKIRDSSGYRVDGGFDINNDNTTDAIIAAPNASPLSRAQAGEVYVIYGQKAGYSNIDLANFDNQLGFKVIGANAGDQTGFSVEQVGDINVDGIGDILISSYNGSHDGKAQAGLVYAVYGKQNGYANDLDLLSLSIADGFKILGANAEDLTGYSISGGCDINFDNIPDIIIGAPNASPLARNKAGEIYVIYSRLGGYTGIDLSTTFDITQGFRVFGSNNNDNVGNLLSRAGDVNADGIDDMMALSKNTVYVIYGIKDGYVADIDLKEFNNTLGFKVISSSSVMSLGSNFDINYDGISDIAIGAPDITYVIYGKTNGYLEIDLSTQFNGFKITGITSSGSSVASAGDVNLDGIADIIIGAPNSSISYVIYGRRGGYSELNLNDDFNGFRILGINQLDKEGCSVNSVGDFNKDGIEDLIIGSYNASPLARSKAGETYIIYGSNKKELDLSQLTTSQGFKNIGSAQGDQTGNAVSGNFDINHDGISDMIIGSSQASPLNRSLSGKVTIIYGRTINSTGVPGFEIIGNNTFDSTGSAVASAGDINFDGIDDIIIGANQASPSGRVQAGVCYIIYGKKGSFPQIIDLSTLPSDLPQDMGFKVIGSASGDLSGTVVAGNFDLNHDGISDILIGANNSSPLSRSQAGAVYIIYGKENGYTTIDLNSTFFLGNKGFRIVGANNFDGIGFSASGGFDINRDGIGDIIIGAPKSSPDNRPQAGSSYIIYGKNHIQDLDLAQLNLTTGFKISGATPGDLSGQAVGSERASYAIISSPRANYTYQGKSGIGIQYVLYNKNTSFTDIDLNSWNTSLGFRIFGGNQNDTLNLQALSSVNGVGDITGDGISDIVIGVSTTSLPNRIQSGATYVIYGKSGNYFEDVDLNSLQAANGTKILGAKSFDATGFSVASAGDVNFDGIGDVIIGAYNASSTLTNAGEYYVIYGGKNFNESYNIIPPLLPFPGDIDLNTLNNSTGIKIFGANPNDLSGRSISELGDVNKDGIQDFIICAPNASPYNRLNAGEGYVIYGNKTFSNITLDSLPRGFKIQGEESSLGYITAKAGDVNHDGIDDIAIASLTTVYIIYGKKNAPDLDLKFFNDTQGFKIIEPVTTLSSGDLNNDGVSDLMLGTSNGIYVLYGPKQQHSFKVIGTPTNSLFGYSDVNDDKITDLIIGSLNTAYVLFGSSKDYEGEIDLESLSPSQGFKLLGVQGMISVSSGSDLNHDGIDDIFIGASYASPLNRLQAGELYVIYGSQSYPPQLNLTELTAKQGFKITGARAHDNSGHLIKGTRDINGDQIDDLLIDSPNAIPRTQASMTYILYGKKGGYDNLDLNHPQPGFRALGLNNSNNHSIAAADFNHDGAVDILISAPNTNSSAGITCLLYGTSHAPSPVPPSSHSFPNYLLAAIISGSAALIGAIGFGLKKFYTKLHREMDSSLHTITPSIQQLDVSEQEPLLSFPAKLPVIQPPSQSSILHILPVIRVVDPTKTKGLLTEVISNKSVSVLDVINPLEVNTDNLYEDKIPEQFEPKGFFCPIVEEDKNIAGGASEHYITL